MKIELDIECPDCKATGLYVGMAEKDGSAVVCSKCKGTGCYKYVFSYNLFNGRKERDNVKRVYSCNTGIMIGESDTLRLKDFGGIPYEDWKGGGKFTPGTEDRQHTCPAWFYQVANYELKPHWKECIGIGCFSNCKHFSNKNKCWKRWDKEFSS